MHIQFVPSPTFFQIWGPYLWIGADIRMLSPPSDRGWRRLKIRSDVNFAYGHSKRVSIGGEKFPDFSQKRQSSLGGGWRSAPSAQSVTVIYTLDIEDICPLHITTCEPSLSAFQFHGEKFSNI